jgi:hypothetical protein
LLAAATEFAFPQAKIPFSKASKSLHLRIEYPLTDFWSSARAQSTQDATGHPGCVVESAVVCPELAIDMAFPSGRNSSDLEEADEQE